MKLTLELGEVRIIIDPRMGRVVIIPAINEAITLTLREFERAIQMAKDAS